MFVEDFIVTGVLAGIVASFCYSMFLLLIKPKIDIADEICKSSELGEENIYRIKIVNKSHASLSNVKYHLYYVTDRGDGIKNITEIKPLKTCLHFVRKNNWFKKNGDNAIRLTYRLDPSEYDIEHDFNLEFNVLATHSISNSTRFICKHYTQNDIKVGVYETKNSTGIICTGVNQPMKITAKC